MNADNRRHHPILGTLLYVAIGLTVAFGIEGLTAGKIVIVKRDIEPIHRNRATIDNVKRGIELMKASNALQFITVGGVLQKKEVAFAIADYNMGMVLERRFWIQQSDIEGNNRVELIPSDTHSDIRVRALWWNAYNSLYEIIGQPNLTIVANKFLIPRDFLPEQSQLSVTYHSSTGKYADVVFAPYSPDIHADDVIASGRAYMNQSIDLAFEDLDKKGVMSLDNPNQPVVDTVSVNLLRTIMVIEHVDYLDFLFSSDHGFMLSERILVLLGANREWAFRYTNSPAGANGLAQFIESTYIIIRKAYPKAALINDYRLGMADHVNAVKAMILFFDYHRNIIHNRLRDVDDAMLAATYNGGASRVIESYEKFGPFWQTSETLPRETRQYLEKYNAIKNLNLF